MAHVSGGEDCPELRGTVRFFPRCGGTLVVADINIQRRASLLFISTKAETVAAEYGDSLGVKIIPTSDTKGSCLKSQIVICETPSHRPVVDMSCFNPGSGLVSMMCKEVAEEVFFAAEGIAVDYWEQLKTCHIPLAELVKDGKMDDSGFVDMSDLVLGNKKVRFSDDQFVFATSLGLGALDVMIGYKMYENAVKMGLGTKVRLWNKPLWE